MLGSLEDSLCVVSGLVCVHVVGGEGFECSGHTMTVFHRSLASSQLSSAMPSDPSSRMTSSQFRSWLENFISWDLKLDDAWIFPGALSLSARMRLTR